MLFLEVPSDEEDDVKLLGAEKHIEFNKWYVNNKKDYYKFEKWILNNYKYETAIIICDYFYIVEGIRKCFKCNKETNVIGFGVENYFDFYQDNYEYNSSIIHITNFLGGKLSSQLMNYLKEKYNYCKSKSLTTKEINYYNHCQSCNSIQGDYFLFSEVDSPFSISNKKDAEQLKIYKIPLKYDFIFEGELGMGSEDYLIKKYATKFKI